MHKFKLFTGTPPIYKYGDMFVCIFVCVRERAEHTNKIRRKSTIKLDRIMDGNLCRTIRTVLAHSQLNIEQHGKKM